MKQPERWTYAGIRVTAKNQRTHAWLSADGDEHWYSDTGSFVIGGLYDVEVERKDDHLIRTRPQYTGQKISDDQRRKELFVKDQLARTRLGRLAMERTDAKQDELASLLEPLSEFAATLRTRDQRDAFAVMVLRTINTAWK